MTGNKYNPELQNKLGEFIKQVGSQNKAAAELGYSTATLSTYRASTYNGDIKKMERRLKEYFDTMEDASLLYATPDFVPTSISTGVYETIRICHLKGGLAVECGDAGIGKTKAAKKYLENYPNSTIYVSVNPCLVSITAFLKMLCRYFKIPINSRKDDMWFEIEARLRGGKKVLIIDEAQHLPIKTIEAIRAFYDANPSLGVILIGNGETVTNRGGKRRESFSQISNRTKLTEIRHTAHITRDDIKMLFPILDSDGHEKEVDFLHVVAQSEQGIRGAVNLFSNASDNENISHEGLIAMAKVMKIVNY